MEGRDSANDLSTIWRESIIGGPDMRRRDLLVTALNEAAEALIASGAATLREVAETLVDDERAIFSRIALHLIANHPDPDVAAEWLGNEDAFRNFNLEREYAELAQVAFAGLDPQVKEQILAGSSMVRRGGRATCSSTISRSTTSSGGFASSGGSRSGQRNGSNASTSSSPVLANRPTR